MEIRQKILTPHAPPFKVTALTVNGVGTDQSAIYNFLFVFPSNYGLISYRFKDKRRHLQKNPTPLYSTPSLKGFPLEFCNGGGDGKSRCPYHVKKCADMSLRFDTEQNRHWTDRQTERQTELVKQYRVLHARSAIDAR